MTDSALRAAQQTRQEVLLSAEIDRRLDVLLSARTVGPEARSQLRELLKHYAKSPHPFRACVRDNMKRFGPGRTERVCATLKDIIRGTTRWRNSDGVAASAPEVSEDLETLLLSIPDDELEKLVLEVARA
jgi:hypothetical protein